MNDDARVRVYRRSIEAGDRRWQLVLAPQCGRA
jgi:hypothetical protein